MSTTAFRHNHEEVQEVLFRFMRSFDNKNWDSMLACLCDSLYCDYSSFRTEKPGQITKEQYVALRKETLIKLKTQHNLSNLLIKFKDEIAEVDCNYTIFRFHPEFAGAKEDFFHSYGQYLFGLKYIEKHWKISSIIQTLLVNDGNPKLHG